MAVIYLLWKYLNILLNAHWLGIRKLHDNLETVPKIEFRFRYRHLSKSLEDSSNAIHHVGSIIYVNERLQQQDGVNVAHHLFQRCSHKMCFVQMHLESLSSSKVLAPKDSTHRGIQRKLIVVCYFLFFLILFHTPL